MKELNPTTPLSSLEARRDLLISLFLGVGFVLLLLALRPFANVPMNDDWSYVMTTKVFAETGKVVYNGWGSPILLPQMLVGAVFIKVFGFSYTTLAWVSILSGSLAIALLYRLARAVGVERGLSVALTLTVFINPICLGLTPTFMTELFSLALALAGLHFLFRSLIPEQTGSNSPEKTGKIAIAARPFFAALSLGLIVGANRQNLWIAFFAALFVLCFFVTRSSLRFLFIGMVALFSTALLMTLWFNAQPYTVPASYKQGLDMLNQAPNAVLFWVTRTLLVFGLPLAPIALTVLFQRRKSLRWLLLGVLLLVCYASFAAFYDLMKLGEVYGPTQYGQYITERGVQIGGANGFQLRPIVLPMPVPAILNFLGATGLALSGYLLFEWLEDAGQDRKRETELVPVTVRAMVVALAAFSLVQILIGLPWFAVGNTFDRYNLLTWPGALILLCRQATLALSVREVQSAGLRRSFFYIFTALFAFMGIAFADEYFHLTHARADAFKSLLDKGIPRTSIDAGYELNAETQYFAEGHINNSNIKNPPNAYDASRTGTVLYMPPDFPAIQTIYCMTDLRLPEDVVTNLQMDAEPILKFEYRSLLSPNPRGVYVYHRQIAEEQPVATP